ncbi:MAG: hypothetical protein LAQ30_10720, partial [Acidobacteriia bacterium]|nr:hypothetical protein [Terriglobia bacterium]
SGPPLPPGASPARNFRSKPRASPAPVNKASSFAVEAALAVRHAATRVIDRWSERCQGARPELDAAFRANKQLLAELISVASAICVQSVPDLVLHLAEACRLGATPEMLRATVGIARSVHSAAMEQIEAVLAGENANFTSTPNGDTLCGPAQGCGCR